MQHLRKHTNLNSYGPVYATGTTSYQASCQGKWHSQSIATSASRRLSIAGTMTNAILGFQYFPIVLHHLSWQPKRQALSYAYYGRAVAGQAARAMDRREVSVIQERTLAMSGSSSQSFADGSEAAALNNAQADRKQDVGWHETPMSCDCQNKSVTATSMDCLTFACTHDNCPSM